MAESRQIIYLDMDHTLCDYNATYEAYKTKFPEIKYPQSIEGFFRCIEPIDGAIEVFQWLNSQESFDVYILTAPSVKNPHCYSEKRLWVEEYLGTEAVNCLIITPNKGLNKGHYLIDDQINGAGQENFEGKLIQFGSSNFPNWQSVKDYFLKTIEKDEAIKFMFENGLLSIPSRSPLSVNARRSPKSDLPDVHPELPPDHPIVRHRNGELSDAELCRELGIEESKLLRYLVERGELFG